jgi:hypothetical protein
MPADLVRSAIRDISRRTAETPREVGYVTSLTPMFHPVVQAKKLVE